jgi:hypothetical protein
VILGNSHAYCSFDPEIIDSFFQDLKTVNLSGPNLCLAHSAILLRQMIEMGTIPEVVVLEEFSMNLEMDELLQISFFNEYSKTWQFDNIAWIVGYFPPEELLAPLFPLIHQHETWKQQEKIRSAIENYAALENDIATMVSQDQGYLNDGFRGIPIYLTQEEYQTSLQKRVFAKPTETNIHALQQILMLSKQYDFEVLFVQSPYLTGFSSDYSPMKEVSAKFEVPTYLLNETHAGEYSRFDFMDPTHLNTHGAISTSVTLAEILAGVLDAPMDPSLINSYQQLQLEDIEIHQDENQVQVTLIPASQIANWDIDWDFYLWDSNLVSHESGKSRSYTFPSQYLETQTAFLTITIRQEGFDYPLELRVRTVNFWSQINEETRP